MKYSYTVALLLSVAKAGDDCAQVCYTTNTDAWDPSLNTRQASHFDVQNDQIPHSESLASEGLSGIASAYLAKSHPF
jgi:hypothetical protein